MELYIPSTVTLTLTTLCPAGLSAFIMYRPLWASLLMGIVTTEVVSEEWIWKETSQLLKYVVVCSFIQIEWSHL